MIHSPTLFAPLVRHDRVHDNDQTVVTVWDLRPVGGARRAGRSPWSPGTARCSSARSKHADAVVVPTHSMAARLGELAPLGERIRVIAGAAPLGFAVPTDEVGRRRALDLPEGFVLLSGARRCPPTRSTSGLAAIGACRHRPSRRRHRRAARARSRRSPISPSAAGIPERSLHVRGALAARGSRGRVRRGARASSRPSRAYRVPVAGRRSARPRRAGRSRHHSPVHAEVIVDGGILVERGCRDPRGCDALEPRARVDRGGRPARRARGRPRPRLLLARGRGPGVAAPRRPLSAASDPAAPDLRDSSGRGNSHQSLGNHP